MSKSFNIVHFGPGSTRIFHPKGNFKNPKIHLFGRPPKMYDLDWNESPNWDRGIAAGYPDLNKTNKSGIHHLSGKFNDISRISRKIYHDYEKGLVDVVVAGSRSGQVGIPAFWYQNPGKTYPPMICLNAGCINSYYGSSLIPKNQYIVFLVMKNDYFSITTLEKCQNQFVKYSEKGCRGLVIEINDGHLPDLTSYGILLECMCLAAKNKITTSKQLFDIFGDLSNVYKIGLLSN